MAPDGLSYTFKLRHGVKFHNGREMKAADVKYSLERTCNPDTASPGAGYYGAIKGFEDFQGKKATELTGITTPDDYTVKIELSHPDSTMLHLMALNFSFVVPKEEVEKSGADFGKHPVGTGAFKVTEWTSGQKIVFERNKDYFRTGPPASRQDHLRDRPGAGRRACCACRRVKSTSPATASRPPNMPR